MARRRMIDPDFWNDEDCGALSNDARLLFLCCVSSADDYGKQSGSVATLKKVAFGFTDANLSYVESLLDEIDRKIDSFLRYEVDGKPFIALLNWRHYQKVDHPTASIIPDPPSNARKKRNDSGSGSKNGRNGSGLDTANERSDSRQLINEDNKLSNTPQPPVEDGEEDLKDTERLKSDLMEIYEGKFGLDVGTHEVAKIKSKINQWVDTKKYSATALTYAFECAALVDDMTPKNFPGYVLSTATRYESEQPKPSVWDKDEDFQRPNPYKLKFSKDLKFTWCPIKPGDKLPEINVINEDYEGTIPVTRSIFEQIRACRTQEAA